MDIGKSIAKFAPDVATAYWARNRVSGMQDVLRGIVDWLNSFALHESVRESSWAVPALQTIHILAVAIVFSCTLLAALRSVSLAGMHWPLERWLKRSNAWTHPALLILLCSGGLLTLAEPERELLNTVFQTKMVLVALAVVISRILSRSIRSDGQDSSISMCERILLLALLALWAAIIMCGRWIAYAGS